MLLLANFLGIEQWLVIAFIALLFFGNRLPGVMRSLGQGVTEFKKGLEGVPEDESKKSEPKKLDDQPVKS
jgi:sec-independent protein translocase protein TatA